MKRFMIALLIFGSCNANAGQTFNQNRLAFGSANANSGSANANSGSANANSVSANANSVSANTHTSGKVHRSNSYSGSPVEAPAELRPKCYISVYAFPFLSTTLPIGCNCCTCKENK